MTRSQMTHSQTFRFSIATLVLLLATAAAGLAQDRRGGVTVYSDADFRGRAETFYQDIPDLERYQLDRRASSVRIDRGCRVRLYPTRDFRGDHTELDTDVARLDRTRIGNDRARSLQVRCGWDADWTPNIEPGYDAPFDDFYEDSDSDTDRYGRYGDDRDRQRRGRDRAYDDNPWAGPWDDRRDSRYDGDPRDGYGSHYRSVTLFAAGNFRGASMEVYRDIPDLRGTAIGNDHASSVSVPPGCLVRLYREGNYRGAYVELDGDVADLGRTQVGNDSVSSVQVRCGRHLAWNNGGSGVVTLYRDSHFRGPSQSFSGDVPDVRLSGFGNDAASSVRVDPGCTAILYAAGDFRGTQAELYRDEPDLGRTPVGNDHVSSIRVRCR